MNHNNNIGIEIPMKWTYGTVVDNLKQANTIIIKKIIHQDIDRLFCTICHQIKIIAYA